MYLTKLDYLRDTCSLVGGAITHGEVRGLELEIRSGKARSFLRAAPGNARVTRCLANRFMRLRLAAPAPAAAMFTSLRALSLNNLRFRYPSDVGALHETCAALESLSLDGCGFADPSSVLSPLMRHARSSRCYSWRASSLQGFI